MLTVLEKAGFLFLIALCLINIIQIYRKRWAQIQLGRNSFQPLDNTATGCRRILIYVFGNWCGLRTLTQKNLAGIQHLFIFWGVLFFSVGYVLIIFLGDILGADHLVRTTSFFKPFLYVGDISGVFLLVGLTWGLIRRIFLKPDRLGPDFETGTFSLIVFGAYTLMVCYFALEGIRINLMVDSWVGPASALCSRLVYSLYPDLDDQQTLYHVFWWVQASVVVGLMGYIPFSHHQHPFFAPVTIFCGPHFHWGRLEPVTMNEAYGGVSGAKDFNQRQLVEFFACTQCGRCQDACPAHTTGKPLSPKKILQALRQATDRGAQIHPFWKNITSTNGECSPSMGETVSDDALWSCTTCMACVEVCPAFISSLDKIVDLRRDRILIKSRFYPEVHNLFRDTETFGDTFGKGTAYREDWALGRNIKILNNTDRVKTLFWVGCQASFHDRIKAVAVALIDLMNQYDPDFAVLGKVELCCGDPVRRLGNEYLFQELCRKNIERLTGLGFERIVTYCPHCYNMIKNEYPQFGGSFEVIHYTELLMEWLHRGILSPQKTLSSRIVYHDPCYLARGNGIVDAPREILASLPGVTHNDPLNAGGKTFCCGGGGGQMWLREAAGKRINDRRINELAECKPDVIASSCPYCLIMLEDGAKSLGLETVKCRDLLEVVKDTV